MNMSAKDNPMMTMVKEKPVVTRARVWECSLMTLDKRPPVDDATIRVTNGRSHVAVIFERD